MAACVVHDCHQVGGAVATAPSIATATSVDRVIVRSVTAGSNGSESAGVQRARGRPGGVATEIAASCGGCLSVWGCCSSAMSTDVLSGPTQVAHRAMVTRDAVRFLAVGPNAPDFESSVLPGSGATDASIAPDSGGCRDMSRYQFSSMFAMHWITKKSANSELKISLEACRDTAYSLGSMPPVGAIGCSFSLENQVGSGVTRYACESFTASVLRPDRDGRRDGVWRLRERGTSRDDRLHDRVERSSGISDARR